MSLEKIIDIAILWGPTIFLVVSLVLGIIWGLIRGFRKSVILFIQAIVACIICTVTYSIVVNMDSIDRDMVSMINSFMGSEYALQEELEVSQSCLTMRDILVEFIPKNLDYGDGIALIVKENGQYLATLVDMAYHLIWALVFVVIYFILVFVFYIIYLIFYPEGRYRRRKNRKYRQLQSEKPYRKRPLLGALVGGGRSIITSLIVLSFVGSLFFIIAGGEGNREKDDYEFGDKDADLVYSIYQSIGSYGTEGIFKILNTVKDSDDVPYYLYAADLVFQGELNDPNRGINENVNFRNELSAYVGFTENTLDLLLKHGGDQIRDIVLDRTDEEVLDILVEIMAKPEFQDDFGKIIDEFDGQTYFINFSLSLVDSIVNHLDETDFADDLGSDTIELINILFKKGYLSDSIPSEKQLKEELANNPNANPEDYTLAYINPTSLLTKEDTKELVKLVLAILQIDDEQDEVELISDYANSVVPAIEKLSILSDARKEEINPVLSRLYQYLEATLIEDSNKEVTLSYTKTTLSNGDETLDLSGVDWITEINMLLDIAFDVTTIVDTAYDKDAEYYELFFDIFKEGNEAAAQSYDNIVDCLANSELLGLVLSSKYVDDALVEAVPNIYISDSITYLNKYDEQGNVTEYGELYNLLTAIRVVGANQDNREIVSKLMDSESLSDAELLETISDAVRSITTGDNNALDYVLDSKLVLSIASAYIIESKDIAEGFEMYIPDSVLERDENGKAINIIKRSELEPVLYNAANVLDVVIPYLDKDNSETYNKITPLVNSLTEGGDDSIINKILDSTIIQGTVVNVIADTLTDESVKDYITMPDGYMSNDSANVEKWIEEQELSKLVNAVSVSGLDIDAFMVEDEDEQQDAILEQIKLLGEKENSADETQRPIVQLLKSKVLHYTLSGLLITEDGEKPLFDGVTIVVPEDSKENGKLIKTDEISGVVKVLPDLLDAIDPILEDSKNIDIDLLVSNLASKSNGESVVDRLLNSNIIHYTLAGTLSDLLSEDDLSNFVALPEDLLNPDGSANLDAWVENAEISSFINAVVDSNVSFNALAKEYDTSKEQTDAILDELTKEEANLGSLLDSKILHYTVSSLLITEAGEEPLIEGISIVVPSHENDNGYIKKSTLIHLVDNITVLLPDSSISTDSEEYTNTLVLNAINNRDNLLENTILSATIVTILNDGVTLPEDVRELITIPANLEEASKDIDTIGTNDNPWTNELPAVLDALDELLGITGNDDFTFDNPNLADDVLANVSKLNEASAVGEGTKLDICYESIIIKHTLTNQIINNEDITNTISIPSDVIIDDVLAKEEIKSLISAVNELEIDLTNPSIEALPLATINEEVISSSVIIRATLYKQLNTESSDLVIPNLALENNDRIAVDEINTLFAILKNNASLLFGEADSNGKYNINNVSLNELSVNNIKNLNTGSIILEATIINQLVINEGITETVSIPSNYNEAAERTVLINTYGDNNIWNQKNSSGNDELDSLINALGYLVDPDANLMDSANISQDMIMNNVLSLNEEANAESTKLELAYESIIVKSTLRDTLANDVEGVYVPAAAYTEDSYVDINELSTLIDAVNDLELDLNNVSLEELPLKEINSEMVSRSKILSATIYANLSVNETLVIPNTAITLDDSNNYLSQLEMQNLLDALKANADSFFGTPTIKENKEYYNITNVSISSLTVNDINSMRTASIILEATIINQLVVNEGLSGTISMPLEYKNDAERTQLINTYGNNNIWNSENEGNNELDNLINALGHLVGYDVDLMDPTNMSEESLMNNVLTLNDDQAKLDETYASVIIKSTLTDNIKELDAINVPAAAYEEQYISKQEIYDLITAIEELGLDINNPNLTSLPLADIDAELIAPSYIIRATLYAQFNDNASDTLIIPAAVVEDDEDNDYITNKETIYLLEALQMNANSFFGTPTVNGEKEYYDITNVSISSISINMIKSIKEDSIIMQATIINQLSTNTTINAQITMPVEYSDDATSDNLKATYGNVNVWSTNDELDNLIQALEYILGEENSDNNLLAGDVLTEDVIVNNVLNLNELVSDSTTYTKLHVSYYSEVFKATITNKLANMTTSGIYVPKDAYSGNYIDEAEMANLIISANKLGINLTSEIGYLALDYSDDEASDISKSIIIRATLYAQFNGLNEMVIPNKATIIPDDTDDYSYLKTDETTVLLQRLKENKDTLFVSNSEGLYDVTSVNINEGLSINLINNLKKDSLILQATIISNIITQGTISLPDDYSNEDLKTYYGAEDSVWYSTNELDNMMLGLSHLVDPDANITEIDTTTLKTNITDLNSAGVNGTKLDDCYSSAVITMNLTTELDKVLDGKVDSTVIESVKTNGIYNKEELEALVNAMNELDLDSSMDTSNISSNVTSLNNPSTVVEGSTKLDVLYTSIIIQNILTDEVDLILTSEIIVEIVRDEAKENNIYIKDEIAALIDSMNILGLTNEIDTQAVTNKVLDLDNDDLTIIYKSTIVKYILSVEVKTTLTGNINSDYVEFEGIQERIVEDGTNSYYNYIQSEILGLINALNEILADGQTLDDINSDVISNAIFNANIDNLYGSFMIRNELSAQLALSLEPQNINSEINAASMEIDINEEYIYKAIEVQNLIDALKAIGVDNSDSLEGTINVDLNIIKTNLKIIYKSNIVVDILTAKIDGMLEGKAYEIDYRPYAKEQFNNTNVWLFKQEEVANLINVLANYNLEDLNVASLTIDEVSTMVNGSVVIQAVASKTIVDNNQLIVPTTVKDTINTIENSFMIEIDHINALLAFLKVHVSDGLNTLNITKFNPTLTADDIELIGASVILNATIANEIYANEFVCAPVSVKEMTDNVERTIVDNVVVNTATEIISINSTEVTAFIAALVTGLNVSNIRTIDNTVLNTMGDLTAEKERVITSSRILNATITNNLSISEEGLIIYALTDTSCEENAENENTYVYMLTDIELINLIEAIKVFSSDSSGESFEVNLSIDNLTDIASANNEGFDKALDSNVIRLVVTQVLINKVGTTALGMMGITIEQISAYNLQISDTITLVDNVNSISKEQILEYF